MCVPETCKLLGWWCGHFQIADPLLKTRVLRRATCEKLTSVQQLWHFQNPSCSYFHGHGRRSWSHSSTKIQPCNPSFQCLFGLTIVYNYIWCNWFCTLCQNIDSQPFPGLSSREKLFTVPTGLQNTKGLFLSSTMTPSSPTTSTKTTTTWIGIDTTWQMVNAKQHFSFIYNWSANQRDYAGNKFYQMNFDWQGWRCPLRTVFQFCYY